MLLKKLLLTLTLICSTHTYTMRRSLGQARTKKPVGLLRRLCSRTTIKPKKPLWRRPAVLTTAALTGGTAYWATNDKARIPLLSYTQTGPALLAVTAVEDPSLVKWVWKLGANHDPLQDSLGFTPLHVAASKPNAEGVKQLLKHGADPNKKNHAHTTALGINELELEKYNTQERREVAWILRKYGAKQTGIPFDATQEELKEAFILAAAWHIRQKQKNS